MKQLVLVLALSATGLVVLGAGLRPDAFYAGDPGVKLISSRNAIDHPFRPFEISLPTIGSDRVPHVEPFFAVHGDHAHAVALPIFPLLTAPFLKVLGIRGVYVLPALGLLLTLAACASVASALDGAREAAPVMAVAALATPFLFYGLEFWEHTLALAVATLAWALFLRGRTFAGGVLIAMSVLLRPEAAWFGLAALLASPLLPERPPLRAYALSLAGALVAIAPFELYSLMHFGTWIPQSIGVHAGLLAEGWSAERMAIASHWFLRGTDASFWGAAPVVVGAAVSVAIGSPRGGRAYLWAVVAVDVLLVLASAPNDGGAQWGPRYLLFAFVPLTVLAADAVQALPRRSVGTVVLLTSVALWCVWVQRAAYRQLQSTKVSYGRIVDFVTAETVESNHIVTNVWWLDQIAASSIGDRQIFYAPEADTGQAIIRRLSDATVPVVTVVSSASESADTSAWIAGTCYFEERRNAISIRDLVAVQLRHRCPQGLATGRRQ